MKGKEMKKFGIAIQKDPHIFFGLVLDKSPTLSLTLFGYSLVFGMYYEASYMSFIPVDIYSEKELKEISELEKMYYN